MLQFIWQCLIATKDFFIGFFIVFSVMIFVMNACVFISNVLIIFIVKQLEHKLIPELNSEKIIFLYVYNFEKIYRGMCISIFLAALTFSIIIGIYHIIVPV